MARLLQRFLLAVATVLLLSSGASGASGASGSSGSSGSGAAAASARLVAGAMAAASPESATAEASARAPTRAPLHHVRDGSSHRALELKALEIDSDGDDDDDDARRDCAYVAALSLRCVPVPRRPDRDLRGELKADTSRFTAGSGLPRGPPARSALGHTSLIVDRS